MNALDPLIDFLEWVWQDTKGFVYVPYKEQGSWHSMFAPWPRNKKQVAEHLLARSAQGCDSYFAPALFRKATPKKEAVLGSWLLWADLDGNADQKWPEIVPAPSCTVRTSFETHQHLYWKLNTFIDDVTVIEDRNRAIAMALHADTSGWDADQVLRAPGTTNQKNGLPVEIVGWK